LNINANNPLGLNLEEQRRQAIRAAYYVDQLVLGTGPQMTATEVVQRTEEKMRLLGPVLGRLQAELLQPMIDRAFNIMVRQNRFPAPPPAIADMDIEIEYVSPLARAQRQNDLQAIMRMFEIMSPAASIDPSVFDHVDFDGLVRHLLGVLHVPARVSQGEAQVMAKREQRAEAEQAQMQQMEALQTAEAMGAAAPAMKVLQQGNQAGF
jgi:hypothetical protein